MIKNVCRVVALLMVLAVVQPLTSTLWAGEKEWKALKKEDKREQIDKRADENLAALLEKSPKALELYETAYGWAAFHGLKLGAVSFIPFPTSLLSEHHDQALSIIIFSATLSVAGIALLGTVKLEQSQLQATDTQRISQQSPSVLIYSPFATAVFSSEVAVIRPVLGAWIWAAFPIVAAVLDRNGR